MDILLHIGAHRTATTSFQAYMRAHRDRFDGQAIGFWGPQRTRNGLLQGLAERPQSAAQARRAVGRVRLNLAGARRRGLAALVVSDENMLGSPRQCLRAMVPYPAAGERLARIAQGFDDIRRIYLQIRALDLWWASMLAYLLPRGVALPDPTTLQALAQAPRSWRHVITDIACACPDARLHVSLFEDLGSRPDRLAARMTGALLVPEAAADAFWINRSPDLAELRAVLTDRRETGLPEGDGRWMPFSPEQAAQLREAYADDLFWLRAGADGLARLTEEDRPAGPVQKLAAGADKRGRKDDGSARRLARTR